ncbi:MAG: metallophosphoesterase [Patescibacteria group bacterium]|nr:metallophosphoesterase [Patescibacteria group bacterium]
MAKAFLFSDLHASLKQLSRMGAFLTEEEFDLLIFAGDFVNMGEPVWFTDKFITVIDKSKLPFLWVPGNNDFGRSYFKLNARYKSLEGNIIKLLGRTFTGVGGSPASWAGQYAGESMIDKKKIAGSIFVSHVPPPGILTLQQKDLQTPPPKRRFSDSPLVHICGHLHYRWGTAYLGQTKVIQLASLETGHYAILDLETLAVEFRRF